uniref:Uncharacterized protein LOC116945588 n=1 Tax=Petromyzon marinus TaxID=7757 RepID=A0AAJ7TDP1_PETMA|nr:uncharacterized protein LOC116945588 [Petromyzon marinus]
MSRWKDKEALLALPATLDDDALPTLITAPKSARATLQSALRVLATVYGPPSDCRQLFHERRRGQKELPLAYRTALLALAKAAFPRMDCEGVDAMVTEKLLALAQDLQIVVIAADDADMCSLRATRNIHVHLLSQRRPPLGSNGAAAVCAGTSTIPSSEEIFAVGRPAEWRSGKRPARTTSSHQEQPKTAGATARTPAGRRSSLQAFASNSGKSRHPTCSACAHTCHYLTCFDVRISWHGRRFVGLRRGREDARAGSVV